MFNEQNIRRDSEGKFAPRSGSSPEDGLLATRPELDQYWSDVATLYSLNQDERTWLAEHLGAVDQSEWTPATTSRSIIADALCPHAQEATARADQADAEFATAVDADVRYEQYQSGEPMMVVESKTGLGYEYMSTGDMEKVTHYVALRPYTYAADIPAKYQAAKRIALAVEANADERRVAFEARDESIRLNEQVRLFEL